jgi:hypothetical protein
VPLAGNSLVDMYQCARTFFHRDKQKGDTVQIQLSNIHMRVANPISPAQMMFGQKSHEFGLRTEFHAVPLIRVFILCVVAICNNFQGVASPAGTTHGHSLLRQSSGKTYRRRSIYAEQSLRSVSYLSTRPRNHGKFVAGLSRWGEVANTCRSSIGDSETCSTLCSHSQFETP